MDCLDWGIRQLRVCGELDMRQMILVLEVLRLSRGRMKRFSNFEIYHMCKRHTRTASEPGKGEK